MQLMRDANFGWVFIGIESSDPQTLKDTRKTQNTRQDVLQSIRTIYGYGIDVLGGFIVGFDNDTLESFETQYRFIMDSGIQAAMIGLLTALPRTPLYERLEREGRLRLDIDVADNTKLSTNVIPKKLGYDEMIGAYKELYRRLLTDRAIADRIRNKLRHLGSPVYEGEYSPLQRVGIVLRLLAKGIAPGGLPRVHHFLRSVPWRAPDKLPLVIVDWIAGLAMRDYVRRHFEPAGLRAPAPVERRLATMRAFVAEQVRIGRVSLVARAARIELSLSFDVTAGHRFFRRLGRHLDRLLRFQGTTLTLNVDALPAREVPDLERLLAHLARHGDRVFVLLGERLQRLVQVDSSRFNLVLAPAGK